jgi:hypothetical protein
VLLLLALFACREKDELLWLEGSRYGWEHFNHRLAHWETRLGPDGVDVAVIGGTSTTDRETVLPKGCDAKTCQEFPASDNADVLVRWARAETASWHGVRATTSIVTTSKGATGTVKAQLPEKARSIFAVIEGFSIDGGEPLTGGDACYAPENGWMPTEIGISIGDLALSSDGMEVTADVGAIAVAGNTLEDVRQCIDEVAGQAQFRFDVDVLFVEGSANAAFLDVDQSATYDYEYGTVPDPQEEPPPIDLNKDLRHSFAGWAAIGWTFNPKDPDARGTYLRTLGFEIVAQDKDATATGIATNYSPITQLSGLDYAFHGVLQVVDLGTDVTRGTVEETVPAALDAEGAPIVTTFPL